MNFSDESLFYGTFETFYVIIHVLKCSNNCRVIINRLSQRIKIIHQLQECKAMNHHILLAVNNYVYEKRSLCIWNYKVVIIFIKHEVLFNCCNHVYVMFSV